MQNRLNYLLQRVQDQKSDSDGFLWQRVFFLFVFFNWQTNSFKKPFNLFPGFVVSFHSPLALQLGEALTHVVHGHFKELVGQIGVVLGPTGRIVHVVDEKLPVHWLVKERSDNV